AAYMADGYARASGRPGICMAQVIGALNLAAGLRDAWLAHSPVIAMTGGREPKTKFRKVYQEIDDMPAFEPVTKFNATVDDVSRFPDMVRQAFRVAVSGTPGPVHLQFRGNEGQVDAEEADMEPLVEEQFARVPPFRPEPEDGSVRVALRVLQDAERPVIVAGGGVRASGAGRDLVALAEKLSIPVATSLNGKDSIPGVHPLSVGVAGTYSRESANRVVGQADLVCFVGTETGGMTTHFWAVPAGLGAKCGAPERPVVVFTGDAGLWYHIGEIETAVRWKINSVTVVNNNASGNQSKRGFDRVYGGQQTEQARELWTYRSVNFARIAEEIGALGIRVEKP